MREIKFRGRRLGNGNFVYGWLVPVICRNFIDFTNGEGYCRLVKMDDAFAIVDCETLETVEVEPESVAQLVGYDADNAEVYEGDVLIDDNGHEYIATLDSMLLWTKDPQLKYWHLPFNQSDEEDLPTSPNKLLWDFYKACSEKLSHTALRLKKE